MPESQELTDVREAHRFDEASLTRYLEEHLEGFRGPLTVRQFEGGQSNPTYLLRAPSGEYVLRKKPPGTLLPTAHMVEREFRVLSALRDTDVPVAKALALCEDPAVIGTTFFVMEFVRGRVFWDPTLPDESPTERQAIYDAMNDVLAKLHGVDYRAVGLEDYGKPGNYFARQIKRWSSQYLAAKTEEFPEMDRLMEWLPGNVPDDDTTSIVHGDYRLDNMIFHPEEPRVIALLDWELSTLGHPLADLAYNCMPYHATRSGTPGLSSVGAGGTGIPTEAEYVAAYCRRTGRQSIPKFEFYLAFSLFRLAAITQGVYQRSLQGNASSTRAKTAIVTARVSGKAAWEVAQRLS
jgi:aminoglycoside phosphotransferase (APT) family kinase protein